MTSPDGEARTPRAARGWLWVVAAGAAALIVVLAARVHAFDLLSLAGVRRGAAALSVVVADHRALALGAYFVLFLGLTAAAVPGTLWLIILAGLLFGVWPAAIATVLAGSLGGAGLFFAVRAAPRPRLQAQLAGVLAPLEAHFKADEALYLLSLRIAPFVPYPVANIAPALLGAAPRKFIWTLVVGLAATAPVYTWIGAAMGVALREETDAARVLAQVGGPMTALSLLLLAAIALRRRARDR